MRIVKSHAVQGVTFGPFLLISNAEAGKVGIPAWNLDLEIPEECLWGATLFRQSGRGEKAGTEGNGVLWLASRKAFT